MIKIKNFRTSESLRFYSEYRARTVRAGISSAKARAEHIATDKARDFARPFSDLVLYDIHSLQNANASGAREPSSRELFRTLAAWRGTRRSIGARARRGRAVSRHAWCDT